MTRTISARPIGRQYGSDMSRGRAIVAAVAGDSVPAGTLRAWPNALPAHRSPCRVDATKGLRQHRCSATHAAAVEGYRAWREHETTTAEAATSGYATELAEYWREHGAPTFGRYLRDMRDPA